MTSYALIAGALAGLVLGPPLALLAGRTVDRRRPRTPDVCTWGAYRGSSSLVPLRSWWRHRCLRCEHRTNWRQLSFDMATASAFALVVVRFGFTLQMLAYAALFAVLVVLSAIDAQTHLLPNVITYPALAGAVVAVVALGMLTSAGNVGGAVAGGVAAAVLLLVFHLINPAGLGFGDVKLAPTLGLFIGWLHPEPLVAVSLVLYALFVATLVTAVVGLGALVLRRRRLELPFGPALAAGTVAVVALSPLLAPA